MILALIAKQLDLSLEKDLTNNCSSHYETHTLLHFPLQFAIILNCKIQGFLTNICIFISLCLYGFWLPLVFPE